MKLSNLFILFVLLLVSCHARVEKELDRAEAILHTRPDSSLICLRSIDTGNLTSSALSARYALLMSAALDKNYIDVTSDSLIIRALHYYSRHGNAHYKMLSWYYDGIILKNGEHYPAAIVAFEKAENTALKLKDYYQLGLIYRNIADIFNITYNNPEAITYRKKAIGCFDQANAQRYKEYAELSLADDYSNSKQYLLADSLFRHIQEHYSDPYLVAASNIKRARILVVTDSDNQKALYYYRITPLKYYSYRDYARRAVAHERMMEKDSADYWLSKGYALCRTPIDSAATDYSKSRIAVHRGQFKDAYYLSSKAMHVEDSLTRVLLHQSVSLAQRDYYKRETERKQELLRVARLEMVLGLVFVFLMALALVLWFRNNTKEKDWQLQEQMSRLALKDKALIQIEKNTAHLLGSLFSARIADLDQLSQSYFNAEDDNEKEEIFKQIKKSVSSIRNNPGMFLSLEEDLNRYCNGVMMKLRAQVPRIKGENLRIISLFFAGFSYDIVMLLTGSVSVQSLKMVKSRFRKEIQLAHAPDEEFFLQLLETKKTGE